MASADTGGWGSAGSSVAAGAAIGSVVPGIGTAVGAAVGAVVGVLGLGANKKKRKADRLRRQAKALQNAMLRRQAIVEYQQASALAAVGAVGSGAGTQRSSGVEGILASLRTQVSSNLKMNTELYNKGVRIDELERKAANLNIVGGGIMSLFQGVADAGGLEGLKSTPKPKFYGDFVTNYSQENPFG